MRQNILIGIMTFVWLVLVANIIWQGTDGRWMIEDVEKIAQLEVAKYTNQIIVVAVSDEECELCLYECEAGSWQHVLETEAVIGKNGLGKTKEGDGKTPIGVFCIVKAFGILKNPGTQLEYTEIGEEHYWVDDSNSNYYNQFVSTKEVMPNWSSAEHIVEFEDCYNYVLATSYNMEQIKGKGSAVFLHCTSRNSQATEGCIAIPEVYMREIMKHVNSQCILIIDREKNILLY